jgi:hypothetical protein
MNFALRYQDRIYNRLATSGGRTRSECASIAAEADAEIRDLRRVLRGLAANAGALRAFEPETRAAIGNANWQAIADYVAQADNVLGPNVGIEPPRSGRLE